MKKIVLHARLNTDRDFICDSRLELELLSCDLTRQGWKILGWEECDLVFTRYLEVEVYGSGLRYRLENEEMVHDDTMTYPRLRRELRERGVSAPPYSKVRRELDNWGYWIGDVTVDAA